MQFGGKVLGSSAKRHHYVPRFYLEYFASRASGKPLIWVYDKQGSSPRVQAPHDTAVEGYFYSFEEAAGARDGRVEAALATIESTAKPILDRWQKVSRSRPEAEEVREIARFLAVMHTRVPRTIAALKEMQAVIVDEQLHELATNREVLRRALARFKRDTGMTPPSLEVMQAALTKPKDLKIEMYEKHALARSLKLIPAVEGRLLEMNWCLCDASSGCFFISSDTPFVLRAHKNAQVIWGAGLGLASVEVVFPISSNLCLFLDRKHGGRRRRVSKGFVVEANRRTAYLAERFVFSEFKTRMIETLVNEVAVTTDFPKLDRAVLVADFRSRMEQRMADEGHNDSHVSGRAEVQSPKRLRNEMARQASAMLPEIVSILLKGQGTGSQSQGHRREQSQKRI